MRVLSDISFPSVRRARWLRAAREHLFDERILGLIGVLSIMVTVLGVLWLAS